MFSCQTQKYFYQVMLRYWYKQGKFEGFDSCDWPSNLIQIGFKSPFCLACVTLKFDGWPRQIIGHLFMPCQAFCIISKTYGNANWSYSPETSNLGQNRLFLPLLTFKFDGWHWKWIGHSFCATSSFLHHFITIGGFKVELQSGNAEFGSKLAIFCTCDLEIWQMTLKNKRVRLLCYFKLCASFHNHRWIQARVTVRKRRIRVQMGYFLPCVTLQFDRWPWKAIGHFFYAILCIIS